MLMKQVYSLFWDKTSLYNKFNWDDFYYTDDKIPLYKTELLYF